MVVLGVGVRMRTGEEVVRSEVDVDADAPGEDSKVNLLVWRNPFRYSVTNFFRGEVLSVTK